MLDFLFARGDPLVTFSTLNNATKVWGDYFTDLYNRVLHLQREVDEMKATLRIETKKAEQ